jgi:phosphoglucomutase
MCGSAVKDKDGVSALAIFYEWTNHLYSENKTVSSHLKSLYEKYGTWVSHNAYYICKDPAKTLAIFNRIRNWDSAQKMNYPKSLGGFKVISTRDLTVGYDSTKSDLKPTLAVSSTSQMITFRLENDCLITLRTSGTEPKIKYYTEYKGTNIIDAQCFLDELVVEIIDELLEPSKNGLK